MKGAVFLAALAAPALSNPPAEPLRFITCPIYRDTDAGKKSGCWLADDRENGVRYDVSLSPIKPDWNFAVLVEGTIHADATAANTACGGVVLDPVRVSILTARCPRDMLPAEGFTGRKFVLPQRNLHPLGEMPGAMPRPYTTRLFTVPFAFGSAFVSYQLGDYYMDQAAAYAAMVHASKVEITGYAATRPAVVSGQTIAEPLSVAKARAEIAAEWIERSGVAATRVRIRWRGSARPAAFEAADGIVEPSRRRVEIRVIP